MRGIGDHIPPPDTQPCPDDNTPEYVERQVHIWRYSNQVPHYEVAREIAAWWQAPRGYGSDFERFAGAGLIVESLVDAIDHEIGEYAGLLQSQFPVKLMTGKVTMTEYLDNVDALNALHALRAYVLAAEVTPWGVGHNMAGYSPEPDNVQAFMSFEDAYSVFVSELDRLKDHFGELTGDHFDDSGNQTCGECEECSTFAFVSEAWERHSYNERYRRRDGEADQSESFQISGHRVDVYWLTRGEPVTYGKFLESQEQ